MKNKVLIIDADLENCKQIKYSLLNTDTDVFYIHSVSEGLQMIRAASYSLIILDILLSQHGGLELLREVKELNDGSLLVLSEKASSAQRVLALKYGADDVLAKPYALDECLARAQALMRRYTELNHINQRSYVLVSPKPLIIDTARRVVVVSGNEVVLTRKEYEILLYLFTNSNLVLSYGQIYRAVWHEDFLGDNAPIFNHIRKLRKKLGIDGLIKSVYGIGYLLVDSVIR